MERVAGGRGPKPAEVGDIIQTSSGESFDAIEFARTEREKYIGEVGRKLGNFIYHFFPLESQPFPENFEEILGESFLEVFKFEDRVRAVFVPEFHSWAVIAVGFAVNLMSDDLAIQVFSVLDKRLE